MLFRGIASIAYRRNVTLPDAPVTALSICLDMSWSKSFRQPQCMPTVHRTALSSRLKLWPASKPNPRVARPQYRCTATQAAKGAAQFICSSCGNTSYQYFGRCPMCHEFETCDPSFVTDPAEPLSLSCLLHSCIQNMPSALTSPWRWAWCSCSCKEVRFASSKKSRKEAPNDAGQAAARRTSSPSGWLQGSQTVSNLGSLRTNLSAEAHSLQLGGTPSIHSPQHDYICRSHFVHPSDHIQT